MSPTATVNAAVVSLKMAMCSRIFIPRGQGVTPFGCNVSIATKE